MDGDMLPVKNPAEAALHGGCVFLNHCLLQLSDVAFVLTVRSGVISRRFNGLGTIFFVEYPDLEDQEHCAIVRHHPQ